MEGYMKIKIGLILGLLGLALTTNALADYIDGPPVVACTDCPSHAANANDAGAEGIFKDPSRHALFNVKGSACDNPGANCITSNHIGVCVNRSVVTAITIGGQYQGINVDMSCGCGTGEIRDEMVDEL